MSRDRIDDFLAPNGDELFELTALVAAVLLGMLLIVLA